MRHKLRTHSTDIVLSFKIQFEPSSQLISLRSCYSSFLALMFNLGISNHFYFVRQTDWSGDLPACERVSLNYARNFLLTCHSLQMSRAHKAGLHITSVRAYGCVNLSGHVNVTTTANHRRTITEDIHKTRECNRNVHIPRLCTYADSSKALKELFTSKKVMIESFQRLRSRLRRIFINGCWGDIFQVLSFYSEILRSDLFKLSYIGSQSQSSRTAVSLSSFKRKN